jgi:hypothetical protein
MQAIDISDGAGNVNSRKLFQVRSASTTFFIRS